MGLTHVNKLYLTCRSIGSCSDGLSKKLVRERMSTLGSTQGVRARPQAVAQSRPITQIKEVKEIVEVK